MKPNSHFVHKSILRVINFEMLCFVVVVIIVVVLSIIREEQPLARFWLKPEPVQWLLVHSLGALVPRCRRRDAIAAERFWLLAIMVVACNLGCAQSLAAGRAPAAARAWPAAIRVYYIDNLGCVALNIYI